MNASTVDDAQTEGLGAKSNVEADRAGQHRAIVPNDPNPAASASRFTPKNAIEKILYERIRAADVFAKAQNQRPTIASLDEVIQRISESERRTLEPHEIAEIQRAVSAQQQEIASLRSMMWTEQHRAFQIAISEGQYASFPAKAGEDAAQERAKSIETTRKSHGVKRSDFMTQSVYDTTSRTMSLVFLKRQTNGEYFVLFDQVRRVERDTDDLIRAFVRRDK